MVGPHRAYAVPLADGGYRPAPMRHHDPFSASRRRYDVPQLPDSGEGWLLRSEAVDGPIRVCAVVDRYPPLVNAGGEWMLHGLLAPLVADGCQVDVVTQTTEPYTLDGVDVWPRSVLGDVAAQADVMVGHLMWTREAVEVAAAHQRPLVYLVHNHRQLRHWSLTAENVTITVWNSRWVAEHVHTPRRRGVPDPANEGRGTWPGPSLIVRPPVRVADYGLDRDPADGEYVTMINMTAEKGARLFYALADREPRLFLAVEGGYGSQTLPGYGHPNVTWQPQTPDIRDDVYARTRVLLVPSEYESWGRVALEAMASGIPVLAHPTAGLQEACGDGATFLDRARVRDWSDALADLDDPEVYAAASARARARAAAMDELAAADIRRWQQAIRVSAAAGPDFDPPPGPGTDRPGRGPAPWPPSVPPVG